MKSYIKPSAFEVFLDTEVVFYEKTVSGVYDVSEEFSEIGRCMADIQPFKAELEREAYGFDADAAFNLYCNHDASFFRAKGAPDKGAYYAEADGKRYAVISIKPWGNWFKCVISPETDTEAPENGAETEDGYAAGY